MMSKLSTRIWCVALLVFLLTTVALVNAPAESLKQIIVKCSPEDLDKIRAEVGAAIVAAIPGHYLLNVPSTTDKGKIESVQGKGPIKASENPQLHIQPRAPQTIVTAGAVPSLGAHVTWYNTPAREAYTNQPAGAKISLKDALTVTTGVGMRVAIIDTGVDENHPTLARVIVPGKNYVGRTAVPSEFDDPAVAQSQELILNQSQGLILNQSQGLILNQSQGLILNQSKSLILNQSQVLILNQSQGLILNQSQGLILNQSQGLILNQMPREFGHGTMMAGLVHFVAPNASIIPLKAFDASGAASEWNVVQAIYDAVSMRADVINMSFSASQKSKILEEAVEFAASKGVVLVGSAGNNNTEAPTYPASIEEVVAVSALDLNDQKAPFSNFGQYVALSAPGVNLVSTYPGGLFAMGSGTSDSTPLVSGMFALAKQHGTMGMSLLGKVEASVDSLQVPERYEDKLGKGRINAAKAVHY